MSYFLNCGCRMSEYQDEVLEPCHAHDPHHPVMPTCACDRRDAEECRGRSAVYKCGCACHPFRHLSSEDVHEAQERRWAAADIEQEQRCARWDK